MRTPWEFVEKYYPNYSGCEDIALSNDLQKLLDKEFEIGDCAHKLLLEDYEGYIDNPQIKIDADVLNCKIYEKAIEGYLSDIAF